jgi:dTDP-4-amino-4,6-dideoxygalactose transaminase
MPAYLTKQNSRLKNTEFISKRVLSLPIFPELTKLNQFQVISNLKDFFQP